MQACQAQARAAQRCGAFGRSTQPKAAPTPAPTPVAAEYPDQLAFVRHFRTASPYIAGHRGCTFVIVIPGQVLQNAEMLVAIVDDIAMLQGLGVKIVLVLGAAPQIDHILRMRQQKPRFIAGYRLTDELAMEAAMEAAGTARTLLEALLSKGPAVPMVRRHTRVQTEFHYMAAMRVVSGNYVAAKRRGVVDGVDYGYTGEVRFVDRKALRQQLDCENLVLLSNLGYSTAGELLNCNTFDVATHAAVELDADKLICLHLDEVSRLELPAWLSINVAQAMFDRMEQTSGDFLDNCSESDASDSDDDADTYTEYHEYNESNKYNQSNDTSSSSSSSGKTSNGSSNIGSSNGTADGNGTESSSQGGLAGEAEAREAASEAYNALGRKQKGYLWRPSRTQTSFQRRNLVYSLPPADQEEIILAGAEVGDPLCVITPTSGKVTLGSAGQQAVEVTCRTSHFMPPAVTACYKACLRGVKRAHLVDARMDGGILLELYSRDGIGTMISTDFYEGIRRASAFDVVAVKELLEPLEAAGIVVPRPLEALSAAIETFVVVEREQRVLACAQLTPIGPSENGAFQKVGEVAAFCVHPDFRGTGRGDSLLDWVEQDARCQGYDCLVLLTTRTADWFQARDFRLAGPAHECRFLARERRERVNIKRNSQLYLKRLEPNDTGKALEQPGTRIGF